MAIERCSSPGSRILVCRPTARSSHPTFLCGLTLLFPLAQFYPQLDFAEFVAVIPVEQRQGFSEEQLREIFDSVDFNGSGDISMDEYFLWTLSIAAEKNSTGLEDIFKKYDKSGEGTLDAIEFARACEDMGFGAWGHDLFLELDQDGTRVPLPCHETSRRMHMQGRLTVWAAAYTSVSNDTRAHAPCARRGRICVVHGDHRDATKSKDGRRTRVQEVLGRHGL